MHATSTSTIMRDAQISCTYCTSHAMMFCLHTRSHTRCSVTAADLEVLVLEYHRRYFAMFLICQLVAIKKKKKGFCNSYQGRQHNSSSNQRQLIFLRVTVFSLVDSGASCRVVTGQQSMLVSPAGGDPGLGFRFDLIRALQQLAVRNL